MTRQKIPRTGSRGHPEDYISALLQTLPDLHLGEQVDIHDERRKHLEVFVIHNIPEDKVHPIHEVDFTAIRGPHGTILIRTLCPGSGEDNRKSNKAGGLIYFYGGGYTVGPVDEFENDLRMLAELSSVQIYAIEYKLSTRFPFSSLNRSYDAVIDAPQGDFGKRRGISTVLGGGDSAGGNMTAAIALRRKYNGYYLECNGIFSFADHYLPRGTPPSHRYISPGMQATDKLSGLPPAAVYTNGFDPLRDIGVEYASKLQEAGNKVIWRHYNGMMHGWVQMTAWSDAAQSAVKDVASDIKALAYQS